MLAAVYGQVSKQVNYSIIQQPAPVCTSARADDRPRRPKRPNAVDNGGPPARRKGRLNREYGARSVRTVRTT